MTMVTLLKSSFKDVLQNSLSSFFQISQGRRQIWIINQWPWISFTLHSNPPLVWRKGGSYAGMRDKTSKLQCIRPDSYAQTTSIMLNWLNKHTHTQKKIVDRLSYSLCCELTTNLAQYTHFHVFPLDFSFFSLPSCSFCSFIGLGFIYFFLTDKEKDFFHSYYK